MQAFYVSQTGQTWYSHRVTMVWRVNEWGNEGSQALFHVGSGTELWWHIWLSKMKSILWINKPTLHLLYIKFKIQQLSSSLNSMCILTHSFLPKAAIHDHLVSLFELLLKQYIEIFWKEGTAKITYFLFFSFLFYPVLQRKIGRLEIWICG